MDKELETYIKCGRCLGEGLVRLTSNYEEIVEDPCTMCNGEGYFATGKTDGAVYFKWLIKKIKKILQKLEIPEDED